MPYEDFLPQLADKNISFSNNQITTAFIEHYSDGMKEMYEKQMDLLTKAYESQIASLKEEITFLRKQISH